MDLQLVRTFVAVSESGSFAAASDRLFVSQSAVSLRVQRLEEHLGQELFIRSSEGVSLTRAGQDFKPYATALLRHWQAAREAMNGVDSAQPLRIEVISILRGDFLAPWLAALKRQKSETPIVVGPKDADVILSTSGRALLGYNAVFLGQDILQLSGQGRHIHLHWGEDFEQWHQGVASDLPNAQLELDDLAAAIALIGAGGWQGFVPKRHLPKLPQAQALSCPLQIWAHFREGVGEELRDVAQRTLSEVVGKLSLAE